MPLIRIKVIFYEFFMKRSYLLFLIVLVLGVCLSFGLRYFIPRYIPERVPVELDVQQIIREKGESDFSEGVEIFPKELNLEAPFYSQAPFADWAFPWQEACEEASILLAANVYGHHQWTREEFNEEILKMVDWQEGRFGTYLDTTAVQTQEILRDYLHLDSIVHENPTFEDVQRILNRGHFIVMFFSGKDLQNPNYKNGGPLYHVMLIKGYKANQRVVTHDVGTRKGENYVYSWERLEYAMHDFADPIQSGAKRMLEILPPEELVP